MAAARPAPYPVSLVVAGRPCLVVGGGPVAARKVAGLAASGARVTVVAPRVAPAIAELIGRAPVTVCRRRYRSGEAARYRLVVTATGVAEVDAAVAADADAAGVWVNSADDLAHCTFLLPAVHRDGPVTVAVSTGGASPALATWLRRRLAAGCGDALGTLARMLEEARRRLQERGRPTTSVDWQALLDGPLPTLVGDGRLAEARRILDDAVGRDVRAGPP
ncbi:MAG: precorrin-2 dehydrogenase/sirohydrochlorin ferrochelatase family protein [Acidimicrobiales bacterium]